MNSRKPKGYWKDFENVKETILGLEKKLGHFPSYQEIGKEFPGLPTKIHEYYGGINFVAERLGRSSKQKNVGYWTIDRVLEQCRELVDSAGDLPSYREIAKFDGDKSGLIKGIAKYGGVNKIRKQLGLKPKKRKNGFWDEEKIIMELKGVIDDLGYFPDRNELKELGKSYLLIQIDKCRRMNRFRRLLSISTENNQLESLLNDYISRGNDDE